MFADVVEEGGEELFCPGKNTLRMYFASLETFVKSVIE